MRSGAIRVRVRAEVGIHALSLVQPTVNYRLCRACPGQHFAGASLFMNIAMVLHVFNITPPLDEQGKPIQVKMQITSGLSSCVNICSGFMRVDLDWDLSDIL